MSILRDIPRLLSCEHYTELESKRRDENKLSGFEKFSHRFHKVICLCCRRFSRQLDVIDRAAKMFRSGECSGKIVDEGEAFHGLSAAGRERIAAAIHEEKSH